MLEEEFRHQVLAQLAAIREELLDLRRHLPHEAEPVKHQPQEATSLFGALPADLSKRLAPLLTQPPPSDPLARARWLLEVSENVEDYLRYQGEDWPEAPAFLDRLETLQQQYHLEKFVPQEGQPFDQRLHLLLQTLPNPSRRDQVARCARPGFLHQGQLLRRAEVVVYL